MEIDITSFVNSEAPERYSASRAELGQDAGKLTWAASMEAAARIKPPMLDTEDKLDAMRTFARSSGGWDDDAVAAWSPQQVNALFVQWVSGDMREGNIKPGMTEADWLTYEAECSAGQFSGNIYRGDDGRVYFTLGS